MCHVIVPEHLDLHAQAQAQIASVIAGSLGSCRQQASAAQPCRRPRKRHVNVEQHVTAYLFDITWLQTRFYASKHNVVHMHASTALQKRG